MPRSARIDAQGLLYHVIVRGIGQRKTFDDDTDWQEFFERLRHYLAGNRNTMICTGFNPQSFPFAAPHRTGSTGYRHAPVTDRSCHGR